MGEAADDIIEGLSCQQCGEYFLDDDEPGHPRSCAGCSPEQQSVSSGSGKRARRQRRQKRLRERKRAELEALNQKGIFTGWRKFTEYHYQKTIGGKMVNWWPSSQKCQIDKTIYRVSSESEIIALVQKPAGEKQ